MSKKFCVTGICVPEKNYMVDISERIEKITKDYIEHGKAHYLKSFQCVLWE